MNALNQNLENIVVQELESIDLISSFQFPWQNITKDWYGQTLSNTFVFSLVRDTTHLCFATQFPETALCHPDDAVGSYIEGLWEYDVAEFFVSINSNEYLEVNLSPHGAYWAARFCDYRVRDTWRPETAAACASLHDGSSFYSSVKIPLSWFTDSGASKSFTLNVCGIRQSNEEKEIFIAANSFPEREADFHLKELRTAVRIKSEPL